MKEHEQHKIQFFEQWITAFHFFAIMFYQLGLLKAKGMIIQWHERPVTNGRLYGMLLRMARQKFKTFFLIVISPPLIGDVFLEVMGSEEEEEVVMEASCWDILKVEVAQL